MGPLVSSMPPGMVATLKSIASFPDPDVYHGPILKGLMVRGLVRHTNSGLHITWAGQKTLKELE